MKKKINGLENVRNTEFSIYDLIEQLENCVDKSSKVPFTNNKVLISADTLYEIISKIKLTIPEEIESGKVIVRNVDRIIHSAEMQAQSFIEESKIYAESMVNDTELLNAAKTKADDIIKDACISKGKIESEITDYAYNVLNTVEENLSKMVNQLNMTKENFHNKKSGRNDNKEMKA